MLADDQTRTMYETLKRRVKLLLSQDAGIHPAH